MTARESHSRIRGRHWIGASAFLIFSLALLASCGKNKNPMGTTGGSAATIHIVMNAMSLGAGAFSPNPDTVTVNSTVTWKNDDATTHTVTSTTAEPFNLSIAGGGQGSHAFASAGSFTYHCTVSGHTMNGTVVVTP